jgi:hypothetical protein
VVKERKKWRWGMKILLVAVLLFMQVSCTVGTGTGAVKKYAIPDPPRINWAISDCVASNRSIDMLEFVNLSEYIMRLEDAIERYERQVDIINSN